MLADIAHVDAIDGDAARRDVMEALRQLEHRGLAAARGADDGRGLARLAREADILEHALGAVGVPEAHVLEGDARARQPVSAEQRVLSLARVGVGNGGLAFEHLIDALSGHIGARQHDGEHADHKEAHNDDHGVGDERDEVAGLQIACIDGVATEPDNAHRHQVHDEHHERHHEGHHAISEQLRLHQARVRLIEARLLVLLAAERADDRQAREQLARHQVHPVDELLHDLELRHGRLHEHAHDHRDGGNRRDDDPAHGQVGARDHDDAADSQDRRVEHHAQQHDGDHLHELHVVGAARDQRCGAERLDLGIGEADNLVEQAFAQAASHLGRRARRQKAHHDGDDHAERSKAEHLRAGCRQIVHLHGVKVVAQLLILGTSGGQTLLRDKGIGHIAHRSAHAVEHGLDVVFADHALVVRGFHLVKVQLGDLVGIAGHRHGKRHGVVERGAITLAGFRQRIRAVFVLRISVGEHLLLGFGKHHGHQVMGAPGKLLGGNVLHALLLDTRIHDIGGVVGQGQVARSLHTQQHHDHQHHQLVLGKVLDYAHGAPPSAEAVCEEASAAEKAAPASIAVPTAWDEAAPA